MDWFMGKGRRKDKDVPSPVQDEFRPYLLEDCVHAKITDTDLDKMVTLPQGLDYNEWLATHTISFFEHINLLYGTLSEFCTNSGCSSMNGPGNTQYLWLDEKGKKCKCPAPQYVDYVMTFTQKNLLDQNVFPTKYGHVFPSSFDTIMKKILRYLFHVLAHIYHSHYKEILQFQLNPHLNTLCHHFMTFVKKYQLVEEKELCILNDLHLKLEGSYLDSNENKENQGNMDANLQSVQKNASTPVSTPVSAPVSTPVSTPVSSASTMQTPVEPTSC